MATIMQRQKKDGTPYFTATIRIRSKGEVTHSESQSFAQRFEAETWATQRERELAFTPPPEAQARPKKPAKSTGQGTLDQSALGQGARRSPSASATKGAGTPKRNRASFTDSVTLRDLIQRYIIESDQTSPLGRTKRYDLVSLSKSRIAEIPADLIRTDHLIAHVRERRVLGASGATVKNDLIWLQAIFRYARFAWNVPIDPQVVQQSMEICKAERLVNRAKRRYRRPTSEELQMLSADFLDQAARKNATPFYLLLWFAIYSCRRLSEICSLRLPDFDEQNLVWKVHDLKHPQGSAGNDKWAWITPETVPVIHAAIESIPRRGEEDRLFPLDSKTVSTLWTKKMKMLGVEDLHFHDLRHEGCSRLAETGWTIPEIQKVSLHESWGSLQIYVNASQTAPRNSKALGKEKTSSDLPQFDAEAWKQVMQLRKENQPPKVSPRFLRPFSSKGSRA